MLYSLYMDSISISQLKTHPAKIIEEAADYPVEITNRNQTKAYLVGAQLYEKIIAYLEDFVDTKAVKETNFKKGKDFEKVAKKLGI